MPRLVGVEGLAAIERGLGRLDDELRRRQVALADPERDQTLAAAPVIEHLDDAAQLDGAQRRAEFRSSQSRGDGAFAETIGSIAASWTRGGAAARGRAPSTRRSRGAPEARLGRFESASGERVANLREQHDFVARRRGRRGRRRERALFSMLIPLTTRKSTKAMMRKLTATVMKLP